MKTCGQILSETRQSKKLSLDDVTRITKIRTRFLSQLEADDYSQLPNGTVTKGFIRNYAEFLGLSPDHLLAIFRRDFVENQMGQIIPRGMVDAVDKPDIWTPRTTIIALVTLLFTLFGAYLFYQYRILVGPPSLVVTKPPAALTVTETSVEVEGTTDPEATLSVNDHLVALEKGGLFSFRLPLSPGTNHIVITATGKSGKQAVITREVNLTTGQ